MRKHLGWYLKGIRNSSRYKNEINKVDRVEKIAEILKEISYNG